MGGVGGKEQKQNDEHSEKGNQKRIPRVVKERRKTKNYIAGET